MFRNLVARLKGTALCASAGSIAADPNPIPVSEASPLGATTLSWTSQGTETVEVHVDRPDGPLFSRTGPAGCGSTGNWVHDGMVVYLQDASHGLPASAARTLATVTLRVRSADECEASLPRRLVIRVRKKLAPKAVILLYHRVTEPVTDRRSLCVSPGHFAEHLDVLRTFGALTRIEQLGRSVREGRLSRRSVAVTFDDGYADNFEQAKPLLERYDIPATVFVTTGAIGRNREFYWDELDRILLRPGRLPEELQLRIGATSHQWTLGTAARYSDEEYERDCRWKPWDGSEPTPRHTIYRALDGVLRRLPEQSRSDVLEELRAWGGIEPDARPSYRPMTADETIAMSQDRLIEIGAHTVSHPDLSLLPVGRQREEIGNSKVYLEQLLGRRVRSLAYPYGSYAAETVTVARDAGFTCACAAAGGAVRRSSDVYQLPRVPVQDWDGESFARRLWTWLK